MWRGNRASAVAKAIADFARRRQSYDGLRLPKQRRREILLSTAGLRMTANGVNPKAQSANQNALLPPSPRLWQTAKREKAAATKATAKHGENSDADLVFADIARIRCGHQSVSERRSTITRTSRSRLRRRLRCQLGPWPQYQWNFSGRFCVLLSEAER